MFASVLCVACACGAGLGYTGGVPLPRDLAESLAAAFLDRRNIHGDLCANGCSCGIPGLLADLTAVLLPGFPEAAERLGLEGKPFWPQDHPELFQATAGAVGR